ncbi:hypothetical protein Mal64_37030 [Pseudobythopirellula maris]|uniref:Uncharacterized protein n=1 Tax=Pseudobythopirellula maris TaxID=2527991 RepID=A0A5C5ZKD3_9BACT|nr:hypothetical protein [Pseudobythopirellula maris]TWT86873.1 hypothetical protein Mal64_37030 [Pseudobythopirellula maris]
MNNTEHFVDEFASYAKQRLASDGALSIDRLYDEWRESQSFEEDRLALEASLRDMEHGETGRPFDDFANEFRRRNKV